MNTIKLVVDNILKVMSIGFTTKQDISGNVIFITKATLIGPNPKI